MTPQTVQARYDGTTFIIESPCEIPMNMPLTITIALEDQEVANTLETGAALYKAHHARADQALALGKIQLFWFHSAICKTIAAFLHDQGLIAGNAPFNPDSNESISTDK